MSRPDSHGQPASPQTVIVDEEECRYWLPALDPSVIAGVEPIRILQGYFRPNERIRISDDREAVHTIKEGKGGNNKEKNTPMDLDEARRLLSQAGCHLAKLRHVVPVDPAHPKGLVWEIDLYQGNGLGAIKLEVERPKGWEGEFPPPLPAWAGGAVDVTDELSDYLVACALRDFSPREGDVPARLLAAVREVRRRQRRR